MVHESSLFLLPSNRLLSEVSGWRTDGTRAWGSIPHFVLCNSLFWQEAAHSHRGDRASQVETESLERTEETWWSTVSDDRYRRVAISALVSPCASKAMTSNSREV